VLWQDNKGLPVVLNRTGSRPGGAGEHRPHDNAQAS